MSLVLNTNAGDDLYSSDVIPWWIKYPDFTQLLLKPNFWTNPNIDSVIVETINWTNINWYFADMSRNAFYNVNAQVGGIDWWIWWKTINWPIYFISHGSFKWWEIIWKDIIFAIMFSCYSNNNNANITESVWLMHTDWTYTEIASETLHQVTSAYTSDPVSQVPLKMGSLYDLIFKHVTTQWVIAQQGDKICLKITNRQVANWWNYVYQRSYSSFWMSSSWEFSCLPWYYNGSYYINKWQPLTSPCTPIQVSIE